MAANSCTISTILLFAATLLGCGGSNSPNPTQTQTITASQVFSTQMIGQTWSFQNSYGDITTIDIQAAPVTDYVPQGCTVWHFAKTTIRAYWSPGTPNAENWQIVCPAADGSWYSIGNLVGFPSGCSYCAGPFFETQDVQPTEPGKLPYIMVPASATSRQTATVSTNYANYIITGSTTAALTYDSVVTAQNRSPFFPTVPWTTNATIEQIITPLYSGPALANDQHEGIVNERWFFAPGLGLVEIQPVHGGSDTDPETTDGANLTIKRVR